MATIIEQILRLKDEASKALGGTAKAAEDADKKTKGLNISFAAFATAAAATATSLIALQVKMMGSVDAVGDMAARTGLATETILGLRFAAQQAGVAFEGRGGLEGAALKLAASIGDAADGSKKAQGLFSSLGVSIRDAGGELKSVDVVFRESVKALGEIDNKTLQLTKTVELFGPQGRKMIEAFGDLGNFENFVKVANEFGIKVGPEASKAATDWEAAMGRLRLVTEGAVQKISDSLTGGGGLAKVVEKVSEVVIFLSDAFTAGFQAIGRIVAAVGTIIFGFFQSFVTQVMSAGEAIRIWFDLLSRGFAAVISGDFASLGAIVTDTWDRGISLIGANTQEFFRAVEVGTAEIGAAVTGFGGAIVNAGERVLTFRATSEAAFKAAADAARDAGKAVGELDKEAIKFQKGFNERMQALIAGAVPTVTEKVGVTVDAGLSAESIRRIEADWNTAFTDTVPTFWDKMEAAGATWLEGWATDWEARVKKGLSAFRSSIGALASGNLIGGLGAVGIGGAAGFLSGIGGAADAEAGTSAAQGIEDQLKGTQEMIEAGIEALPEILSEVIPELISSLISDTIPALIAQLPAIIVAAVKLVFLELIPAILVELPKAIALGIWELLKQAVQSIIDAIKSIGRRSEERGGRAEGEGRRSFGEWLNDQIRAGATISSGGRFAFAEGGFVDRTGIALVHAGERITSQGGAMTQRARGLSGGGGGMPGIVINTSVVDPHAISALAREIERQLGVAGRGSTTLLPST